MFFLNFGITTWVWVIMVALYALFIKSTTATAQKVWKEQREDALARQRAGVDTCLEIIMIDVSMFVVISLMPFLQMIKKMFCRKIK